MSNNELTIDDCRLMIGREFLLNLQSSFVRRQSCKAFVLVEVLLVVALVGLMAGIAMLSFGGLWGNMRFKHAANELVDMFQMIQDTASTSNRRYQLVLNRDPQVQGYLCREYTETQLSYDNDIFENALQGFYDDSLIQLKYFKTDLIYLDRVEFDYYTEADLQNNPEDVNVYHFIAGHAGWQCGGRIILLDPKGKPWTIVVHRFAKPVELFEGEADVYLPQEKLPF